MEADGEARRAIAVAARDSYGRLLGYLAVGCRDVMAAEDALADAFQEALSSWPETGVPERPEAWLLTIARRRLIDQVRHGQVQDAHIPGLIAEAQVRLGRDRDDDGGLPDERLKMLFLCAHPAIDTGIRTALMLQTVLGLDAGRIASAFLVQPTAMGQRLSRAKARIRDAGITFELPDREQLPARLEAVLEAIYAAYGSGWEDVAEAGEDQQGLADEAIDLGRLVVRSMPNEPEALGLLALMLHCQARRLARRDDVGRYVPLSEQSVDRWDMSLITEAEANLRHAGVQGRIGRFQLEAAIQSVHAHRLVTGRIEWGEIALLYEGLFRLAPTLGVQVGRAAANAQASGAAVGWTLLMAIPDEPVAQYQPYWALKAHLHDRLGRPAEAVAAYQRAAALSTDPAIRAYLYHRMSVAAGSGPRSP